MNKNKTMIFTLLLVITAVQIGLSYVRLSGVGNIVAALLLGGAETILVGLYFMGLDNEKRLIKVTALFPFVLFCIMNGAVILDVLFFSER
jgi:caa(3)-type oxidase subunit IV